jgi:arylsulfatase
MLKPAGYRSYHSGKWHIDGPRLAAGFDRSYSLEDHDRHFYPRNHFEDDKKLPPIDPSSPTHTSILIADHAIKCLKDHAANHADKPFFHYLCFPAPHFPLQALERYIEKYKETYNDGWDVMRQRRYERLRQLGIVNCDLSPRDAASVPSWNLSAKDLTTRVGPGEIGRAVAWNDLTPEQKKFQAAKMAVHAAMIDCMDQQVGRVLDQLKSMNALDNTLILFLSDNGASAEQIIRGDGHDISAPPGSARTFLGLGPGWSTCANTPFRLHKSWTHEGGIATPLIVHWPRGIAGKNELRHTVGHVIDIVPSLLAVTGAKWNFELPTPGRDLTPAFAKDITAPRELWFFHEGHRALRAGDMKLVGVKAGPWELYDLSKDRSETRNLAAANPDKVRELAKRWADMLDEFTALARNDMPAK